MTRNELEIQSVVMLSMDEKMAVQTVEKMAEMKVEKMVAMWE